MEKKKALERRMEVLEKTIENQIRICKEQQIHAVNEILKLETELHILKVFYDHLVRSMKEEEYLQHAKFELRIREALLEQLGPEIKISLICLTEGVCGIEK